MIYFNRNKIRLIIFLFILKINYLIAGSIKGNTIEKNSKTILSLSSISIEDSKGKIWHTTSNTNGLFNIEKIPNGRYCIKVSHIGYKTLCTNITVNGTTTITLILTPDYKSIKEVEVNAHQGESITSSSVINKQAMNHLQPSSFTDLLSLLPGGKKDIPSLTSANSIFLRQAGTGGANYNISALGTLFVTDGVPINSNSNLQEIKQASTSLYGDPDAGRNHVTTGIDMRSIPTDNIESVEIIRGIAPVEYGDLTSGVVLIKRQLSPTPLELRAKADEYSKLLYIGKGIKWKQLTTNLNIDYLDAKSNPCTPLTNYTRFTISLRLQDLINIGKNYSLRWKMNTDYGGSFDSEKYDKEVLKYKDDSYSSKYNRFSISNEVRLLPNKQSIFKELAFNFLIAYENNSIEESRLISLSRDIAVSTTLKEGEHDGTYLPYNYIANVKVEGKPLNIYSKFKWKFLITDKKRIRQEVNTGIEWKFDKNYGKGQIYNPSRPINPNTTYRPRIYKDIPAFNLLSIYAQDNIKLHYRANTITANIGLRAEKMLNLPKDFIMSKTIYLDPRINIQWLFPKIIINNSPLSFSLNAGIGRMSKFPTLQYIYPDKIYKDIIELNYYDINPKFSRLHVFTYVIDPTNKKITTAQNNKWELRTGASYKGNAMSITYFQENLQNGFRNSSTVRPFSFKDYNEQNINRKELNDKPDLTKIEYQQKTILDLYNIKTNGSKLIKKGWEWEFITKRFKHINTRFTIMGAYFKTEYSNSLPMFLKNTSVVIDGKPVNEQVIGYYENKIGSIQEELSTSIMADTYMPRIGLAFSISIESTLFTAYRPIRVNGTPKAYMSIDGKIHPFTKECENDKLLQWLVNHYNENEWKKQITPYYIFLNLKASKDFGKWLKVSLFIDRLIDYMPDYKTNTGLIVRRNAKPYFGMEIKLKL